MNIKGKEMIEKINWKNLRTMLHDSDGCDFPDKESFVSHMQEFRDHGSITDYWFDEPLDGQSKDPDNQWTWGYNPEDIDFTDLPK